MTGHAPTMDIRGPVDRPRLHGGHTGHIRPATPPRQPYKDKGTGHAPRRPCGTQGPATPPRQPYGHQGTGHAPTAAIRGPGDRQRPHGGHAGPIRPATPPRRSYGHQGTCHAPTVAMRDPGTGRAPRRPYGHQGTGNAPTATLTGPGDRPHPHGGHTGPRGPDMPPR